MTTTPTPHTAPTVETTHTAVTETDTRATRLDVLEGQVCRVRDDLADATACADLGYALAAMEQLATLLQHTLQELAHLACETSPG